MTLDKLQKIADMQSQIALGKLRVLNSRVQQLDVEISDLKVAQFAQPSSLSPSEESARERWLLWSDQKLDDLEKRRKVLSQQIEVAKTNAKRPLGRQDVLKKLNQRLKHERSHKVLNQQWPRQ